MIGTVIKSRNLWGLEKQN